MSDHIKQIKLPNGTTYDISTIVGYGTCSTAKNTAAKVVTIADPAWELRVGSIIGVKFSASNSASSVTLNVNNTGAKSIYYNNAVYTGSSSSYCGYANRVLYYMYDGTYWVWMNMGALDGNSDKKTASTDDVATDPLYIIGAKTQSSDGQATYSNSGCYILDGCLYSGDEVVATDADLGDFIIATIFEGIGPADKIDPFVQLLVEHYLNRVVCIRFSGYFSGICLTSARDIGEEVYEINLTNISTGQFCTFQWSQSDDYNYLWLSSQLSSFSGEVDTSTLQTVDKITYIDTYYGDHSNVVINPIGGICWKNVANITAETSEDVFDNDIIVIAQQFPLIAGTGISIAANSAKTAAVISATGGGIPTATASTLGGVYISFDSGTGNLYISNSPITSTAVIDE